MVPAQQSLEQRLSEQPETVVANFPNAPVTGTLYPVALGSSYANSDLSGGDDIGATFNSDVDDDPGCLTGLTWYYGIGSEPPLGGISFYDTVLHEIGHGVGVTTFVDLTSGAELAGFPDIYEMHVEDHSSGLLWDAMSSSWTTTTTAISISWVSVPRECGCGATTATRDWTGMTSRRHTP